MKLVDEDTYEELEFTCPTCGSHAYGSFKDEKMRRIENKIVLDEWWTGHCNGCGFTWCRLDDALYMKSTGVFRPLVVVLKNCVSFVQ